jgi:ParB family transcriptional regulator, chromosome partitioning protein
MALLLPAEVAGMKRPISEIRISKRHRKDLGDVAGLAQSILEIGLLHPIVVSQTNLLLAGQRRLEACRSLGWCEIPVTVVEVPNESDA